MGFSAKLNFLDEGLRMSIDSKTNLSKSFKTPSVGFRDPICLQTLLGCTDPKIQYSLRFMKDDCLLTKINHR